MKLIKYERIVFIAVVFLFIAYYINEYFMKQISRTMITPVRVKYLEPDSSMKIPSNPSVIETSIPLNCDSTFVVCDYKFNYKIENDKSKIFENKVLFVPNIVSTPAPPEGECGFKFVSHFLKEKEFTQPGGSVPKRDDVNFMFTKDDYHIMMQLKTEKDTKGLIILHAKITTWS